MFFASLVLLSAFFIEGIGTYVSVVGLSALFAANPVIITLAVALDVGKVISVSFLYNHWKRVGLLMKSYMTVAAAVLMLITSAGAFGFLSGQFQQAISGTNQQAVMLKALTEEQGRLKLRKLEIDKQIAQLPPDFVAGRTRLMKQFGPEIGRINTRVEEIEKELPKLKIESIKKDVEVGPILYVAQAFDTTPEKAVKWVILTIIFVFDPLAIALLLAGNFLIDERKKAKALEIVRQEIKDNQLPQLKLPEDDPSVPWTMPFAEDKEKLAAFAADSGALHDTPTPLPTDNFEEDALLRRIKIAQEVFSEAPPLPEGFVREEYTDVPDPNSKGSRVQSFAELDIPTPMPPFVPAPEVPAEPIDITKLTTKIIPAGPDTSETKTYTKEDLVALGAPPEFIAQAHPESQEPIFEVLQPSVDSSPRIEVAPDVAVAEVEQGTTHDTLLHPEPEVRHAEPVHLDMPAMDVELLDAPNDKPVIPEPEVVVTPVDRPMFSTDALAKLDRLIAQIDPIKQSIQQLGETDPKEGVGTDEATVLNASEEPREIITIEQITAPINQLPKFEPVRSSLEDVRSEHGDVSRDAENRRTLAGLRQMYEGEVVSVGGPSGRPMPR